MSECCRGFALAVDESCLTFFDPMDCSPPGLWNPNPWNSPGRNTGVGCHFLLQGIFPTQGLNPGLQHCRQILYCLTTREGFFFFFFGKMSDQICAHFFPTGYLSLDEFVGVRFISQIWVFLSDKYMATLILCVCIFYSLEGAFWWTEILNINKTQFINFSLWLVRFVLRNLCLP